MENPKISVIVPVYKVEPYLRRCLDSIVNQTYKNLEIILVDDGSPDNCGAICDEYASRDSRIVVIHKENGGLSSARNAGIDIATGEYIGFVDSDDWIEVDMYEYLLFGAQQFGAQIVQCAISVSLPKKNTKIGYDKEEKMDTATAIGALLTDAQTTNHIWNKLYLRSLFSGIHFPVGRVYEDIAVTYQLFERAEYILSRPNLKYHYVMRESGIVMSVNFQNQMDYWVSAKERASLLLPKYPQYENMIMTSLVGAAMLIWSVAWPYRREVRKKYKIQMTQMAILGRKNYKTALKTGNYGITGRLRIRLLQYNSAWAYFLSYLLWKLYKWKHQAS